MATFIDPRSDRKAGATKPSPRTPTNLDTLAELHNLCRAGADPHRPAPSFRFSSDLDDEDAENDEQDRFLGWTAIEEACWTGNLEILERLGPDPSRDSFDELYQAAKNEYVVRFLARLALPKNAGEVIQSQLFWLQMSPFGQTRSVRTLQSLFEVGTRWQTSSDEEIARVRRALRKMSDSTFVDVTKILAIGDYCSPVMLQALGRTPAIRERMKKVGFIPSSAEDSRSFYQQRPTRSREVLSKFGVAVRKGRKGARQLPRFVQIGRQHRNGASAGRLCAFREPTRMRCDDATRGIAASIMRFDPPAPTKRTIPTPAQRGASGCHRQPSSGLEESQHSAVVLRWYQTIAVWHYPPAAPTFRTYTA